MIVHIRCLNGDVLTLTGQPTWTARHAKEAIRKQTGVPSREQRLFAAGGLVEFEDSDLIESLAVREELLLFRRSPKQARWLARASRPRQFGDPKGCGLRLAPPEIRSDHEVMATAVRHDKDALKYASDELRADRELVLAAVKWSGLSLQYAAKELCRDLEVVREAVSRDGVALQYVDQALRRNSEIVHAAVVADPGALQFVASPFDVTREFRDLVSRAVKKDWRVLRYAPGEIAGCRDIVLAAVRQAGGALQYASEALRADREVALAAVKQDAQALQHVLAPLDSDPEVQLAAVMARVCSRADLSSFPACPSAPGSRRPATTSCSESRRLSSRCLSLPSLLPRVRSQQAPVRPAREAWSRFKPSDDVDTSIRPFTT